MDSPSMEEEEHQDATLNVPVNDHRDLEKSKPLISQASEPELEPGNAVGERGEEGGEADKEAVPSPVQFSCEYCPKVFSSGKALGGHKRIHSQGKKKQPRSLASSSRQLEAKVDREPITTCPVCNAKFPSEKAMSGHMRVHKDRPWRGLQAPERQWVIPRPSPNPSPSLSSSMDENLSELNHGDQGDDEPMVAGVNPSLSLDGTDSRSEKPDEKNGKEDGEEGKPGEMAELADALMSLTHGISRPSGFSPQLEEDSWADSECLPQPETDSGHRTCSRRALLHLKEVKDKKRKLDNSDAGGGDHHSGDTVNSKIGTATRVYNCGICSRSFSSHQAHEGHLPSHKMIKKQTLGPEGVLQEPGSAAARSSSGEAMEQHESCGILGSRSARPHHGRDFDLNRPPAPEADWKEDE